MHNYTFECQWLKKLVKCTSSADFYQTSPIVCYFIGTEMLKQSAGLSYIALYIFSE